MRDGTEVGSLGRRAIVLAALAGAAAAFFVVLAAAAHYRRALALDPTYRAAREGLIKLYYRSGEDDSAARELQTLTAFYPGD